MPAYWSLDDGRVHVMGSPVPGTDRGIAFGVSEEGWAAGGTETFVPDEVQVFHAFLWTGAGDLLMLPGAENTWDEIDSIAHGVSGVRDEVTGRSFADGTSRPTVWRCASLIGTVAGGRVMTARTRCASILLGLVAAALVAVPGASQAAGDTIMVSTTIQAAVDAADPGDTIVVPAGTYAESVVVTESDITIRGSRGAVLDGTGLDLQFGIRVRSLDGSRLDGFTLDGLTIRGYTRFGSQVSGVDNFRLTGTRYVDNPLYGLFPVRCSRGRVDHNDVSGPSTPAFTSVSAVTSWSTTTWRTTTPSASRWSSPPGSWSRTTCPPTTRSARWCRSRPGRSRSPRTWSSAATSCRATTVPTR